LVLLYPIFETKIKKMNNPKVKIKQTDLLSHNWYLLNNITFDFLRQDGVWITQKREVYDRGNGAGILLYNQEQKTIILTRQFRLPAYLNGNETGMMIEVCAGLLDEDQPEQCIIRETEEETGYRIKSVQKILETFVSPGAVTEILHLFIGEYDASMKVSKGGGLVHEQEEIEVIEMLFEEAYNKIATGEIRDAKTIILLQYAKINNLVG
jgi:nudix-type nucleoside diphosphatase (YffH/AdpP family)